MIKTAYCYWADSKEKYIQVKVLGENTVSSFLVEFPDGHRGVVCGSGLYFFENSKSDKQSEKK